MHKVTLNEYTHSRIEVGSRLQRSLNMESIPSIVRFESYCQRWLFIRENRLSKPESLHFNLPLLKEGLFQFWNIINSAIYIIYKKANWKLILAWYYYQKSLVFNSCRLDISTFFWKRMHWCNLSFCYGNIELRMHMTFKIFVTYHPPSCKTLPLLILALFYNIPLKSRKNIRNITRGLACKKFFTLLCALTSPSSLARLHYWTPFWY